MDIFINMKVIINESKFDLVFSNWLKKENIKIRYIVYSSRLNGYDEIIVNGGVYLIQDGNPMNSNPYTFSYKVGEDKQLIFQENTLPIYRNKLFKLFPPEYVEDFFIDRVKNFLQKKIDDKNIPL